MCLRMRGLCAPLLLTAFVFFNTGAAAIADDNNNDIWHVSNAFGNVWVIGGGAQPVSLRHARTLKPGDSIRTGGNGRALLVRGEEYILISPNSAIEIPREKKEGLLTTIIQWAGSIVLDVEKRNVKHFEVETPLLAAVVKGTRFRVTVEKINNRVDVLRGQVEVSDLKSGQYALVQSGQTAKVSTLQSGLSLSGEGTLSFIQQGTPRRSLADPATVTKEQERRAATDSTRNERQIDEAHRDVDSIQDPSKQGAAKDTIRRSSSINPVQLLPIQASKEDHSAKGSALREQHARVPSLLNESDSRNEGVSNIDALRQGVDNSNDSLKSNDDSMSIVLIVGIGFIVSCVVSTLRRRKIERQDQM
jgi:hypothetical protein